MPSSRILQQNSIKTHNNKYEPLYFYYIQKSYRPIKNISYILQHWMQFQSALYICVHAIAVTDIYTAFSDTNRQIVLLVC